MIIRALETGIPSALIATSKTTFNHQSAGGLLREVPSLVD